MSTEKNYIGEEEPQRTSENLSTRHTGTLARPVTPVTALHDDRGDRA